MDEKVFVWLYDMLNAIIEIESFFVESTVAFEIYEQDVKTKKSSGT